MTHTATPGPVAVLLVALVAVTAPAAGAVAGSPAAGGDGPASVTGFVLTQGDQCVPLVPLESGTDVRSFYDYRTGNTSPSGDFSSYMDAGHSWSLQAENASRLFLHEAPNGTLSLVAVHGKYGAEGDGNGYAVTFTFDGLRSSEQWVVQDDGYAHRDDDFERGAGKIDWIWAADRTDGVAVRELTAETNFTITPYFNEAAEKYDEYQRNGTIDDWEALSGDIGNPEVTSLDMSQPVQVAAGACDGDAAPNASLSVPDTTVGQEVTLDASGSTDDHGIAEYEWDFEGDNEVDRVTETPTTTYSYPHATNYTTTVTVVDTAGQTDVASTTVTVTDGTPPAAAVSVPGTVDVGESFTADGSGTTDDGVVVSYDWTFGDGTTATGETATHSYGQPGNYTVSLTATDSGGNADTANATVTVADATPPDAVVSVPETVTAGETFEANATGTTDNHRVDGYAWQFGDDGSASGVTATHSYGQPGNYTVTLVATDPSGNEGSATATVHVEPSDDGSGGNPGNGGGGSGGGSPGGGGGGPRAGGGGGGGSTPDGTIVGVENAGDGVFTVDVDAVADDPALVPLPTAGGGTAVEFGDLPVRFARDDRFRLRAATAPAPDAAPNASVAPTHDGFDGLATLDLAARDLSNGTVRRAAVAFSVPGDRLADANATPAAVSVYRRDGGNWTELDVGVEGPTAAGDPPARDGSYRFRAETGRFGRFAVGVDRPAVAVTDLRLSNASPRVGGTVTATVTVENRGRAPGQFDATPTLDGERLEPLSTAVPAGETRTLTVDLPARTAGTHALALGDETVEYEVLPAETTTATPTSTPTPRPTTTDATATSSTSSGGQPGFGVGAALLALLGAGLLARRRR